MFMPNICGGIALTETGLFAELLSDLPPPHDTTTRDNAIRSEMYSLINFNLYQIIDRKFGVRSFLASK